MRDAEERATKGRVVPRARLTRLVAQAAVLAVVAGATSAFAVLHKQVTVDVDGHPVRVEAFGRTVSDVLASGGITVGDRDLVAPALDENIASDGQIVVDNFSTCIPSVITMSPNPDIFVIPNDRTFQRTLDDPPQGVHGVDHIQDGQFTHRPG